MCIITIDRMRGVNNSDVDDDDDVDDDNDNDDGDDGNDDDHSFPVNSRQPYFCSLSMQNYIYIQPPPRRKKKRKI